MYRGVLGCNTGSLLPERSWADRSPRPRYLIATHTDHRGKGLAQELVKEMLTSIAVQGISHVGLGVFAENASAKHAYEKVVFNLVNEFSSYAIR